MIAYTQEQGLRGERGCKSMGIASDRAFSKLQRWFLDIGFRAIVKDDGCAVRQLYL